jgi:hypothetical protein
MYEDVKLETSLNIWSVGVSGEYNIFNNRYLPYVLLEMFANYIDETKFKTDSEHDVNELVIEPWWMSSQLYSKGTRFGLGAGLGYSFHISAKFGIDVHANYSIYNLFGKKAIPNLPGTSSNEEELESINLSISILYNLQKKS